MPDPREIEAAAGIAPETELDRRRIWAAAQAYAREHGRDAPDAQSLRVAEAMLEAAGSSIAPAEPDHGVAIVTLVDQGPDVDVQVDFFPDLEPTEDGEVSGTPAQIVALAMVEGAFDQGDENGFGDLGPGDGPGGPPQIIRP